MSIESKNMDKTLDLFKSTIETAFVKIAKIKADKKLGVLQ
jgi:hypothetical protein